MSKKSRTFAEKFKIRMEKITFDKRNYRKHSDENKRVIKKSLEELGAGRSVVIDKDGALIAGNGVYEQAQNLKMPVRVVETDGSELVVVKRTDLATGDEKRKRLALADNVASDLSDFDNDLLQEDFTIEELGDWGLEFEIQKDTKEAQEDDFDEEKDKVETVCKKGDIWLLGQHRLMCGDSTSADCIGRLMDGEKADIAFTSPPYNAGSLDIPGQERTGKKYNEYDDNKTTDEYIEFLKTNVGLLIEHANEVFYNVGVVAGSKVAIIELLYEYRNRFKDFIYWKKSNPVNAIAHGIISSAIELIMCFGENNTRRFNDTHFTNGEYYLGVIEGSVASNNEYAKIHKATFPMYLPTDIINNFTSKGSTVLDCFGGTGTTMIAAEQLGRKCYMMELDPHYCDVIIARWEKLTGQKATKIV